MDELAQHVNPKFFTGVYLKEIEGDKKVTGEISYYPSTNQKFK